MRQQSVKIRKAVLYVNVPLV
jgi:hypothetical protein